MTSDYEAKKAHYEQLGYELVSEMVARGQHVAFFDTFDDFGFFTEIAEEVPGFLESLGEIAQTCAEWDGRDPVRLLTRDGYRTPSVAALLTHPTALAREGAPGPLRSGRRHRGSCRRGSGGPARTGSATPPA